MGKSILERAFKKPLAVNFESYDTETLKGMYADYKPSFLNRSEAANTNKK
ncbi:MAG: hypothetical protein JNN11_03535 [Candidatus Doudnabacteria bacterium]|nr:hypothetical protein [Candidatus Doudnabacteria bacterium]